MQVNFSVTRTLADGTVLRFEAEATSVKGAIDAAAEMAGTAPRPAPAAEVKPDAELEEAVTKVEKAAKTETKQAKVETKTAETGAQDPSEGGGEIIDTKPLEYKADVKPTLLKLHQDPRHGADALKALLKKYNAPNGDKIKPEDLGAILADAQALLAA